MIVHFVSEAFEYQTLVADARRIDIGDDIHDPLQGIRNFHSFFGRIDGRERMEPLRLDTDKVRKAFWDRDEFLATLHELCRHDVYVQASDYYSMRLSFVDNADHAAFEARCDEPKYGVDVRLDHKFHGEVKAFLDTLDVDRHEYDCTLVGDDHIYRFREKTVSELVEIKFAFTKPGDHSKPIPSLEAAYAAVAHVPNTTAPVAA